MTRKLSRKTLSFYMQKLGYQVFQAENGVEALKIWQDESPSIVLTDWNMPEMDGAELCRKIRHQDGEYTYLIAITSREETGDLVGGFDAGADDYLTKPVCRDELTARLKAAERIFPARQGNDHFFPGQACRGQRRDTGYHLERIQGYSKVLAEALSGKAEEFPEVKPPLH